MAYRCCRYFDPDPADWPRLNYIISNPQRVFVYVYSASVLPRMVPWFVILIK